MAWAVVNFEVRSMSTILDTSVHITTSCDYNEAFGGEVETERKHSRYIRDEIKSTYLMKVFKRSKTTFQFSFKDGADPNIVD